MISKQEEVLFCFLTKGRPFLWAHIHIDEPAAIAELQDNIEVFIREIPSKMLERVYQNGIKRMGPSGRFWRIHYLI